jgi:hypothetical protein
MIHPSLLCAFGIATALLAAQAPISYSGPMTLPADLYATDGIRLEKGAYQVEVKLQKDGGSLAFLADYKVKAVVNGQTPRGDPAVMPATTPLMGALYLHSSTDPVLTAQERQFSKTGRTQYEEETREWKAVLRSYQASDGPEVYFVFQVREARGQWKRVDFRLSSKPIR